MEEDGAVTEKSPVDVEGSVFCADSDQHHKMSPCAY